MIAALVNSAYRGDSSRVGWTNDKQGRLDERGRFIRWTTDRRKGGARSAQLQGIDVLALPEGYGSRRICSVAKKGNNGLPWNARRESTAAADGDWL